MQEDLRRYAALEISSSAVRIVYGYTEDNSVYVLYAQEQSVHALEGGQIAEPTDGLIAAIRSLINTVNEKLDIHIREVLLAIPPMGLRIQRESAYTKTINLDNHIGAMDISNCISQIKKTKVEDGYRIIDVIPFNYVLDNNVTLNESPVNKVSPSLSVFASIYSLNEQLVSRYIKVVEDCGVKVRQTVLAPFATALYLQDCDTFSNAVNSYYLINIGACITTVSQIANRFVITKNSCFKYGGDNFTEDLAKACSLTMKEARNLKECYGIDKEPSFRVAIYKNLTMKDISSPLYESVSRLVVRLKKNMQEGATSENRYIPIVLTGAGSKLKGLKEIFEKEFGVQIIDFTPYSFGARDKCYQNCLGMIKYADRYVPVDDADSFSGTTITRVSGKNESKRQQSPQGYNVHDEL